MTTARSRLGAADIGLAVLVVLIVSMMIVPLPTWLLDILIATNLSMSVAILLAVLYVPEALSISAFPSLLLLTTLFRLSLNVSSSRLILLQANAGEVIAAFGSFVVRGNYVVGGVLFLILTIIQFVVITKGSERVAEVGARFVLDAMPGKQMAIDAELRSGSIDAAEARRRRSKLGRESQFYGSMDGAMRFVKGDVIASIIIAVVNILAGLAIGVIQRDMAAVDALKRYGLLTIGDGLVSQIPALVLSTAAGFLVTRTASEEDHSSLGGELVSQVFGQPKALVVTALFVFLLAWVPGFPTWPFLIIAGGLFVAWRMSKAPRIAPMQTERMNFVPIVVPWSITCSKEWAPWRKTSRLVPKGIDDAIQGFREQFFLDLGVPLPSPQIEFEAIPRGTVVVALFEIPTLTFVLPPNEDPSERLVQRVSELLYKRAADFIGQSEVQRLVDELEALAPSTVRNVVPKPVSIQLLTDILRRLVEERVSVRDLKLILEALAPVATQEKDPLQLSEYVRSQLRRNITFNLTRGQTSLDIVTLDPLIEDTIRKAVTRTAAGSFLGLAPKANREVLESIRRALAKVSCHTILTQPDIRRFVRKLVENDLPEVIVTSVAELLPETHLREVANANLMGTEV